MNKKKKLLFIFKEEKENNTNQFLFSLKPNFTHKDNIVNLINNNVNLHCRQPDSIFNFAVYPYFPLFKSKYEMSYGIPDFNFGNKRVPSHLAFR